MKTYESMICKTAGAMTVSLVHVQAETDRQAWDKVQAEMAATGRADWICRGVYEIEPPEQTCGGCDVGLGYPHEPGNRDYCDPCRLAAGHDITTIRRHHDRVRQARAEGSPLPSTLERAS